MLQAAAAGLAGSYFELHSADSTTQVRRGWLPQEQCQQVDSVHNTVRLEMVKNEYEAVQLVVLAPSYAPVDVISNVTWSVGPLVGPGGAVIPAPDIVLTPIGFVAGGPCPFDALSPTCPSDRPLKCVLGDAANNTDVCVGGKNTQRQCVGCSGSPAMLNYRRGVTAYDDPRRWWPHILLDHVQSFDVTRGSAQPLLVTVRTRAGTPPGTFSAPISVSADRMESQTANLTVVVRNVTLPDEVSALSLWGTQIDEWDRAFSHMRGSGPVPCNDSSFAELLLDHRMPAATSIYKGVWPSFINQTSALHPTPGSLEALWQRGQRAIVLQSFCDCTHIDGFSRRGCEYEERVSEMMRTAQLLTAAGWAEDAFYVYLLDENDAHETVRNVSQHVKQLLPRATTVVLGDNAFPREGITYPGIYMNLSQLEPGGWLEFVDLFIPRVATYAANLTGSVAAVKAKGRRVGWYSSGVPAGSAGLNTFAEYPAIRPRLLLGTAAWKMQTDAYLYYSINGWVPYSQGLPWDPTALTRTLDVGWVRWINASYDGEGQFVSPGPPTSRYGGFLATLQLEGMRDGLEDLELYRVLAARLEQARAVRGGIDVAAEAAALVVPAALLESVSPTNDPDARTFSEDPFALRAQRRAVVSAIESLDAKLAGQVVA